MKNYTSPEFKFEELNLFEKVADTCWGTAQIWLDLDGNKNHNDSWDVQINTSGGCQGNWSADAMTTAISNFNNAAKAFNEGDPTKLAAGYPELAAALAEEKKATLSLITATPSSNWANTKETSGGGIIIDKSI